MKVKYVGPFLEVQIAATGQTVAQNHQVEVPAEVGRELVKQQDWEKVADKQKEKE